MAVDPDTLEDPRLARSLMANAVAKGQAELVLRCQVRLARLAGRAYEEPLEREFWTAVSVAEELATAENGKTTRLSRTRQKEKRVGARQCLIDWASDPGVTKGFELLVAGGHAELTGEAIVVRHADRFPADVVTRAMEKLQRHGVAMDAITR